MEQYGALRRSTEQYRTVRGSMEQYKTIGGSKKQYGAERGSTDQNALVSRHISTCKTSQFTRLAGYWYYRPRYHFGLPEKQVYETAYQSSSLPDVRLGLGPRSLSLASSLETWTRQQWNLIRESNVCYQSTTLY
ncbi:hypothetical protein RRG08_001750 [Elysia crispata]|uniref:Uncharacterized protein n=1 Tax=Elysia crispata TaxID=231223 RepID=A0AAE1AKL7_9GAST|nr:hypothetical protein RRG08_001750 [Elysia crispata]